MNNEEARPQEHSSGNHSRRERVEAIKNSRETASLQWPMAPLCSVDHGVSVI
jgi:hypothetical protein